MLMAVAYLLLGTSVVLILGWPLLWAMPGQRKAVVAGPESRFLASCAGAVALIVLVAPSLTSVAQPGAENVFAAFHAAFNFSFDI